MTHLSDLQNSSGISSAWAHQRWTVRILWYKKNCVLVFLLSFQIDLNYFLLKLNIWASGMTNFSLVGCILTEMKTTKTQLLRVSTCTILIDACMWSSCSRPHINKIYLLHVYIWCSIYNASWCNLCPKSFN